MRRGHVQGRQQHDDGRQQMMKEYQKSQLKRRMRDQYKQQEDKGIKEIKYSHLPHPNQNQIV